LPGSVPPQDTTAPSRRRAHIIDLVVAISTTSVTPSTRTGVALRCSRAWPKVPWWLSPQHATRPSARSAQPPRSPMAIDSAS
jgi:hypothetical protein